MIGMFRWILLVSLLATPLAAEAKVDRCAYDKSKMLAMDIDTFDQTPGGWRSVANRDECLIVAADLIAAYRKAYDGALRDDGMGTLLYWHEGQLRGHAGQSVKAIAAMNASRKRDDAVWNLYVDATVAFLKGDRPAMLAARRGMIALPKPAWYAKLEQSNAATGGTPMEWPMNIEVVEGLIGCFGQPYKTAYGEACRARFANE